MRLDLTNAEVANGNVIKYYASTLRRMWPFLFTAFSSATLLAQPVPGQPSPMNGETGVQCNPKLSWSMGGTNLIVNGGFEAPLTTGWANSSDAIRFTTTNSLEGTNCLVLIARTTPYEEVAIALSRCSMSFGL